MSTWGHRRGPGFILVAAIWMTSAPGCGPAKLGLEPGGEASESIAIPVRVLVADAEKKAVAFPSLPIHGSPADVVWRLLRAAEAEFMDEQRGLENESLQLRSESTATRARLDNVRESLAREFNAAAPRESDPAFTSRNPLEGISKARAAKSQLSESYAAAFAERVAPVEAEVRALESRLANVNARIESLRQSLPARLFAALPETPQGIWKTDAGGTANLTVPQGEPWFIWASATRRFSTTRERTGRIDLRSGQYRSTDREGGFVTESYRWLVLVPEQLDSSGHLSLDHTNIFDDRTIAGGPSSAGTPRFPAPLPR